MHLVLHVLVPAGMAIVFFRSRFLLAFVIMMSGMLIDADHLLASPIYDPLRCSMGLHPLHTLVPVGLYTALFAHERTRMIGLGLLIHVVLDAIDCQITNGIWWTV